MAIAQKHNRSITERMGHMFEKYAAVSPFVFSPEDHYGIKAAGVDLIVLQNNDIIYCQMKTNKNTLTGSQDGRSKEELLLYNKAWFISAINSSVSWTFKAHDKIERKAGKEFWPLISIPYELVMESVKTLILEIENFIYS